MMALWQSAWLPPFFVSAVHALRGNLVWGTAFSLHISIVDRIRDGAASTAERMEKERTHSTTIHNSLNSKLHDVIVADCMAASSSCERSVCAASKLVLGHCLQPAWTLHK